MFRKVMTAVFVLAMALIVVAPGVEAKSSRVERRIALTATAAGRAIDASGHARFRVDGSKQSLKVEVEARVPAGTRFTVYVTNGGTTVKAGTITITSLGEGELELKNYDGKRLPASVAPVNKITKVTVKNAKGTVIVSGSF
ncbi:MAG: hypothetical protein QOJ59_2525 [Thermomicrobiales bacterium]|jgi:hypothetical protein|nr:hypothetical protein [Thermomicrobiales bacterium]